MKPYNSSQSATSATSSLMVLKMVTRTTLPSSALMSSKSGSLTVKMLVPFGFLTSTSNSDFFDMSVYKKWLFILIAG